MDRSQQISAQWGANVPQQTQSVGEVRYSSQVQASAQQTQQQQRQSQSQQPPLPQQQQPPQPSQPPTHQPQQNGGSTNTSSPPTVQKGSNDSDQSNSQRTHPSIMTSPVPSPFVGAQQPSENPINRVEEDVPASVTQQNSPKDGHVNCDNQVPNVEHRVCFPGQNPHAQPPQVIIHYISFIEGYIFVNC